MEPWRNPGCVVCMSPALKNIVSVKNTECNCNPLQKYDTVASDWVKVFKLHTVQLWFWAKQMSSGAGYAQHAYRAPYIYIPKYNFASVCVIMMSYTLLHD